MMTLNSTEWYIDVGRLCVCLWQSVTRTVRSAQALERQSVTAGDVTLATRTPHRLRPAKVSELPVQP